MDWLHTLLSWFASFSNTMAEWAVKSEGWLWPLNTLAPFLRALSTIADGLFSGFFDFVYWADRVERDIRAMVTQSWVVSYFSSALTMLNQVWSWFSNWWGNVLSVVNTWWQGISTTVLGWVETAKGYAGGLFDTLQGLHNTLQAKWDNFWVTTFPTLASKPDVDAMIKSAFASWTDLFNFWGKVGSEIKAFFVNPVEFIWNKFTDWFFGE